ncbi:MAG: hypothetical protein WAN66_06290 [Limnoraphis robusta]|jgi:hypothetical protein|uniref:Uncharacterized protein n=1 Tax=Limnoraphis robusta CCNP1315 TaxID=3110306 RepID=A0ABU5TWQ8_9CYAN|nr:hypothetical protein [Limnoraphis robusta]MEA5519338.1 hypothetical protein [Limnoraphis robusta CCNP1315]MEA5545596.1 hypothetical protein [Limnoraphis robusta CCNP1324]
MALSDDDKKEILALLKKESEQKQELILASKNNLKSWLEQVAAAWVIEKLADGLLDAFVDALRQYFC